MNQARWAHVSWETDQGVYLIGGSESSKTSEFILSYSGTGVGVVQNSFGLKYYTRYISFPISISNQCYLSLYLSNACGIKLSDDEYIITGGSYTNKIVSRYSKKGWQNDLPSLNTGRRGHACSTYTNNGQQVLIVAGGGIDRTYVQTDSTEIHVLGSNKWSSSTSLPRLLWDLRAVNIGNMIYVVGGFSQSSSTTRNEILKYDPNNSEWTTAGNMKSVRWSPAASVILYSDIQHYIYTCS